MSPKNRHHPHAWVLDFAAKPKPAPETESERAERERLKAEWLARKPVTKVPSRRVEK